MSLQPHPIIHRTSFTIFCFLCSNILVGDLHFINFKQLRPTPKSALGSVEFLNYSRSVKKSFPWVEHYSSNLFSFVVLSLVVTQLLSALALPYLFYQCFIVSFTETGYLPEDFHQRIVRRFWQKKTSEINSQECVASELDTEDKTHIEEQ